MPDWNVVAIEARRPSGSENWRAYWMSRLHVTDADRAGRDPQTTDDGDEDVLDVAHEQHRRLDQARHELGAEARLVQLVVVGPEPLLGLTLAPEALYDGVTGEHLLGLPVHGCRCNATATRNAAGPCRR